MKSPPGLGRISDWLFWAEMINKALQLLGFPQLQHLLYINRQKSWFQYGRLMCAGWCTLNRALFLRSNHRQVITAFSWSKCFWCTSPSSDSAYLVSRHVAKNRGQTRIKHVWLLPWQREPVISTVLKREGRRLCLQHKPAASVPRRSPQRFEGHRAVGYVQSMWCE